ncbi:hypothetical protein HDE_08493 [Halotydeus destructor]|nr:hypothetical protein HDE_08493 [Halotydeus destructor]
MGLSVYDFNEPDEPHSESGRIFKATPRARNRKVNRLPSVGLYKTPASHIPLKDYLRLQMPSYKLRYPFFKEFQLAGRIRAAWKKDMARTVIPKRMAKKPDTEALKDSQGQRHEENTIIEEPYDDLDSYVLSEPLKVNKPKAVKPQPQKEKVISEESHYGSTVWELPKAQGKENSENSQRRDSSTYLDQPKKAKGKSSNASRSRGKKQSIINDDSRYETTNWLVPKKQDQEKSQKVQSPVQRASNINNESRYGQTKWDLAFEIPYRSTYSRSISNPSPSEKSIVLTPPVTPAPSVETSKAVRISTSTVLTLQICRFGDLSISSPESSQSSATSDNTVVSEPKSPSNMSHTFELEGKLYEETKKQFAKNWRDRVREINDSVGPDPCLIKEQQDK